MKAAIEQFRLNLSHVKHLGAIYKSLKAQTTKALDLSDILRAEIVMLVSGLDQYIHQIVRIGMLSAYQGGRIKTDAFLRFTISINAVIQSITMPQSIGWLEEEIIIRHSYQSFQQADKIADAIRFVSDVQLWQEVGTELGMTAKDVKNQLNLIVDRRNKIAHEADVDPSFPGNRWPIDEALVDDAINYIERLAEAIYKIL
jgi:hypothetical protein